MRIGYAGQNGREYVGIGKLMKDRGLLGPGQTSMQGIVAWLRAHPEEGRAIMRENKCYIFFQELTGPGPLGALGLPVTAARHRRRRSRNSCRSARRSCSQLDRPEANGLWIAQDTGGAIKGANRFDTFWGAGEEAARIAGGMQGRGSAGCCFPRARWRGSMRRLSPDEARLWAKVVEIGAPARRLATPERPGSPAPEPLRRPRPAPGRSASPATPAPAQGARRDAGRELGPPALPRSRRSPTATLDLHGHGLATAYDLLDRRLEQAIAAGRSGCCC